MSPIDPTHPRVVAGGIEFAEWLRPLVALRGWNPIEAARQFGVSPEVTRGYLRGFTVPSPVTLSKIENALGESYNRPKATAKIEVVTGVGSMKLDGPDDVVVTLRLSRAKLLALLA